MKSFRLRHTLISSLQDADIRGVRKIAYFLPRVLIPKPKEALTIKTLYGFNMNIDPVKDHGVEQSIYYTGTYEKGTLFIMGKILKEGDVFVDVGANIGMMTIFASAMVRETGKVIAFEPNPDTLGILRSNIELNNLSNIETSGFAVGSLPGAATIYNRWDMNRGGASLIKPDIESGSHDVTVTTLSAYLKETPSVQLIKLDIEGYELEALKGAGEILTREPSPMLIIECSELRENMQKAGKEDLWDFFLGLPRYRLFRSRREKSKVSRLIEIHHRSEMPFHDNIYCFTDQHLREVTARIFYK